MASVTWLQSALDEVDDIGRRIAHDSLQAAIGFVTDVFPATDVLELFPRSGHIVPEFELPDIREIIFRRRYRIVYRVDADLKEIDILAVRDGTRPLGEIPDL